MKHHQWPVRPAGHRDILNEFNAEFERTDVGFTSSHRVRRPTRSGQQTKLVGSPG